MAALERGRGCWQYYTLKIFPVLILSVPFRLFGPNPAWETALLLGWSAASTVLVYELGRLLGRSRTCGLLGALVVTALPAFQYFSRTHLGYPMPFLLLGWLAVWRGRWGWAGLCLGLAITAHYNSWVPVGLSVAALGAVYLRSASWKDWLRFGLAGVAPLLAMDALFFAYVGRLFEWNQSVFVEVLRLSGLGSGEPVPNWSWVPNTIAASNGPLLSGLLGLGVLSPIALRRHRTGLALSLAFLAVAAFYTIQGGLGRAYLVSRVLATSYPFWAVCAATTVAWILGHVKSNPLTWIIRER